MLMKIVGLDLDGIIIDRPPLIPKWLIEYLYRDYSAKTLKYRLPGFWEQKVRQLTHLPFVRPPILKNPVPAH